MEGAPHREFSDDLDAEDAGLQWLPAEPFFFYDPALGPAGPLPLFPTFLVAMLNELWIYKNQFTVKAHYNELIHIMESQLAILPYVNQTCFYKSAI